MATKPDNRNALLALGGIGLTASLWAAFLWRELVRSRGGQTPFCIGGEEDCGALWDGAFAATVHDWTGVPVAGWGLVWGLVAFLLPLLAWRRTAARRSADALLWAVELTASAGLGSLAVLLAASYREGLFCTSCAGTYALVLAYAAVTFLGPARGRSTTPWAGTVAALGATGAAYLLLLWPGLSTPKSAAAESRQALEMAAQETAEGDVPELPADLEGFLGSLPPPYLQAVSDWLTMFRRAPEREIDPPRHLLGPAAAPVRLTEFTDSLCGHCATLHETLAYLLPRLAEGSLGLESRQFPLDGNCNASLPVRGPESVRCVAARAQICMEATGHAFEYAGEVFKNQRGLTGEQVFDLASPWMSRAELTACMESEETAAALAEDVAFAVRYEPRGTPLVLINGLESPIFDGPFLYAMILAGGDAYHPAFEALPPPRKEVLEGTVDAHHGHDH